MSAVPRLWYISRQGRFLRLIRQNGMYLLKARLAELATRYVAVDNTARLRWVEPHERSLIVDSPYRPRDRADQNYLELHFSEGGTACAASVAGEVVAWRLFKPCFQRYGNWMETHCGNDAVFGMAAFTAPHMRGHRLMGRLTAFAAQKYLSSGYTTLVAAADYNNAQALAAHRAIGMQNIGSIFWIRWPFGIRTVWVDGNLTVGRFGEDRPLIHEIA